jgi:hypothetical protein
LIVAGTHTHDDRAVSIMDSLISDYPDLPD